jgi:Flp pilus assembly pilin Flp
MFNKVIWKIKKTVSQLRLFMNDESGQAAPEYAIILVLIAVVIVAAVGYLGTKVRSGFQRGGDAIP